jgi:hypothetical protein
VESASVYGLLLRRPCDSIAPNSIVDAQKVVSGTELERDVDKQLIPEPRAAPQPVAESFVFRGEGAVVADGVF